MFSEWSAECAAEDPVLVVPWSAPNGSAHFIDLRENPYDLDQIAEVEHHPALLQALRALNAGRSPVFTAKCDTWAMDAEDLAMTRYNLDLSEAEGSAGFAAYIDLLWRERAVFVSFPQLEQRLMRVGRLLEGIDLPCVGAEFVIRPAFVDLAGPQEGFAVSFYVKAVGTDAAHAYERWGEGLGAVVTQFRGRDFSPGL